MRAGTLYIVACLLGCIPSTPARAQATDQTDEDLKNLVVTLQLDRQEYFPGELGELAITISNPTDRALQIAEPFTYKTGGLVLLERNNALAKKYGVEFGPVEPGPDVLPDGSASEEAPLVWIRPGEALAQRFHFHDRGLLSAPESFLIHAGCAPLHSGEFRISYWGRTVDFTVLKPVFEGMVKIDLPESEDTPEARLNQASTGTGKRRHMRTYAFALGTGSKHYVCIERQPWPADADPVQTDDTGRIRDGSIPWSRYSRIAESDSPISSLRGESDTSGTITLTWNSSGEQHLKMDRTKWKLQSETETKSSSR